MWAKVDMKIIIIYLRTSIKSRQVANFTVWSPNDTYCVNFKLLFILVSM